MNKLFDDDDILELLNGIDDEWSIWGDSKEGDIVIDETLQKYFDKTISYPCDCGALKAKTTHAPWCSTKKAP
jgi:hypothetical protein